MTMTSRARRKLQRFMLIAISSVVVAIAVILLLFAMQDKIVFFRTPTEIVQGEVDPGIKVRVGGLVEAGSVVRTNQTVTFGITDGASKFTASYDGVLPDLFREGQGVVIEGALGTDGKFKADTLLAKHDENYIPKEVADALKEQGVWQGDGAPES